MLGSLPPFESSLVDEQASFEGERRYRYIQEWKLIHHRLLDSKHSGDSSFARQLELESDEGLFDPLDNLVSHKVEVPGGHGVDRFLERDAIELKWMNSVIRKTSYLNNVSAVYDKIFLLSFLTRF